MPARIFASVLLPAPFSPHRAWHDPRRISKLTASSARTPGKRLLTPAKRTAGTGVPGGSEKPSRVPGLFSACMAMSSRAPALRHLQVLLGHVGESPLLQLPCPAPQVVLGHAHRLHGDDRGDILLVEQ